MIMKRISTAAFVLFGAFASTAFAQSPTMVVNVSHDFVIGAQTVPAGRYVIQRGTASDARLLVVRSLDGDDRAAVVTTPEERDAPLAQDALTFTRVGATFFLTG